MRTTYGWRAYRTDPRTPQRWLIGGASHAWPTPAYEALCDFVLHPAPDPDCSCGIYGSYELREALQYGPILALARPSGRVIPHEYGWRAERAYVISVACDEDTWRKLPPAWHEVEYRPLRVLLEWAVATRTDLHAAVLVGANLRDANLCSAALHRTRLTCSDLSGADLSQADLRSASLYSAKLCGTNLREANLCDADLSHAHLEGADLRGANLSGARLFWANLQGAKLAGATLDGANLENAQLDGAKVSRSLSSALT